MHRNALLLAGLTALAVIGATACAGSDKTAVQSTAATSAVGTAVTARETAAPTAWAAPAPAATAATNAGAQPAASVAPGAASPAKLNLNTATNEQFLTVPGVGDRFVREFNEYRPYTTITQFRRELGKYVSQDQVKAWEQYLFVPVVPNQSDAATLQQLPGVTAEIAGQLIAARPYASTEAFISALGRLVGADTATAGRVYVAS